MVIIIILFFAFVSKLPAQTSEDLHFIVSNNPIVFQDKKPGSIHFIKETSEIKILAIGLIHSYQRFISSQHDNSKVCIFTPSCSHFGLKSIRKYGIFYGILMTSDRLQRCNNLGKKYYPINFNTGKFEDPVDRHYYHFF